MSEPYLSVAPPLPPGAWARRPAAGLPFPLAGATRLHAQARQGLYQGLKLLGLGSGDVALLPAYHHGSEIEAYVRAGLSPRFYDTGTGLVPDPAQLDGLLTPDVRVVHLIHYLGLAQPVAEWRAWADGRRLLLVEDTAQGWLGSSDGRPLGSTGDVALFSVYKSVGVPDGGATIVRGGLLEPGRAPGWGIRAAARRQVMWLGSRSGALGSVRARRTSSRPYDPGRDFELGDPDASTGRATLPLLRRLAVPAVAERRRDHYRRLLEGLSPWVPAPFRQDPGDASPFAFPVVAFDKRRTIATLRSRGIGAVDAWSVPHPSLPEADHPGAARLRAGIILLPVHQELRIDDVTRILRVTRDIMVADR